jgi:hypothetical protein
MIVCGQTTEIRDSYSPRHKDHTPENRVVRRFEEKVVGEK